MAKASAKTDDKVMALVEQELKKKPEATVDELYDKAKSADKSVGKLTKRQFNARYPLQVKRRQGGMSKKGGRKRAGTTRKAKAAKGRRSRTPSSGNGREAVRSIMMKFASEMASAEARKDLVQFLAGIDRYVDDVMKAATK